MADLIVADSVEQSRQEAGDLILSFGQDEDRWKRVRELAEVAAGKVAGRTSPSEITIFKSNGIATEDIAVAGKIFETAQQRGMGRQIQMWEDSNRAAEARGI